MAFYKITYNEKYRFATLHNYGCTFRCPVCSYKLRSGENGKAGHAYPKPNQFLDTEEIKQKLVHVDIDTLYFMGGEPTVAPDLPELLDFAKNALKVRTCLGHTNGSHLPMPNLDGANVGLKAWNEKTHLEYTGREKKSIFDNFEAAHQTGIELKANVVYIPDFVDVDQIESIVPATAIGGALLMVLADTLARTLAGPAEIPVGILTAMVGAPVFLWLLQRRHLGKSVV